jgi:signal transduction histidine kinase
MRRLYVRIYLALIASLVAFGLLAATAAGVLRLFEARPHEPWPEAGAGIAERLLPAGRSKAELAADLEFWSERTGYSLALLTPDKVVIAQAGAMPPGFEDQFYRHPPRGKFWRGPRGIYGLTLGDGRVLAAAPPPQGFGVFRFLRLPALFLGLGLAVAIGFYPLIRQLTRRLERLEAGVARFGEGDFTARVKVAGRDEIAKLAATFNASAARIESLMRAHRMLLAHASHELRSPLSRLRMAVERLTEGKGGEAARAEAVRNIAELDDLVNEILLASRLQAGAETVAREEVDLAGLLAEECAAYGADLTVSLNGPIMLDGDSRLLRRLFRNLLENAKAHGGPEAPEATLGGEQGGFRVTICDRGPGVPQSEREKIFEPFYQVKDPAPPGGAGLGLALVREIAARHGGQVRCLSREGGGACFEVVLPRRI